jgi:hypothetical protein
VADQGVADAPAAQPDRLGTARVVVPWSARVFAFLRMLLAFVIVLTAIGILGGENSEIDDAVLGYLYVGSLIALPFAAMSFWSNMRAAFAHKARLEILSDRLAIYHGGVFRKPFAIAWEDVEAVAFDDRPFRFKRSGNHRRFSLKPEEPDDADPLDWLYSRSGGAPLPLLGQVFDVPNLAVLFRSPKVLRPVRRWQKAFPSKLRMGPPIHKRKSRGLLVRIKDAPALEAMLEPWGIVRPITWEMLQRHTPAEEDRKKARRSTLRDDAILFLLIVGQAAIPLIIALSD